MKRTIKRVAVTALAGCMAAGLLGGCSEKKLDGTQTVATVDGEEIALGVVSLVARQQQAQLEQMYRSFMGEGVEIWDQSVGDEDGTTYGDQLVADCLTRVETMVLMRAKAADYGVEFTDEDQAAVDAAAAEFVEANSEETMEALAVSEDQVKEYLELETYGERVYQALLEEAAVEITDEEAQQSGFTYVSISTSGDDLTDEDLEQRKENAQKILDEIKADPDGDMDAIAKEVDESYTALEGNFVTNETEDTSYSYPDEVIEALRSLKEGEVYGELIETDTSLYIVRLDSELDEDATESRRTSLKTQKENEYYSETTTQWLEDAEITVEDKVLETLKVTDDHTFTIVTPDAATDAEIEDTEEISEEMENAEVIDEDMSDATLIEDDSLDDIENATVIDDDTEDVESVGETEDMTPVDDMDEDLEPVEEEE